MAKILNGKDVVAALNGRIRNRVEALKGAGVYPTLGIVRVGEREDDIAYERGAMKRCETIGVNVERFLLPADVSQDGLIEVIEGINGNNAIHGVLLFRPLPKHIDDEAVRLALAPEKDVDGITDVSMAGVFANTDKGFPPCTAKACMELLEYYGYELKGKRVTVVGRSLVVGKPVSLMLQAKHATVTMCHTRTADLPGECRKAEILVVAAGKAGVADKNFVAPGQVVVDVGINFNESGNLVGDVEFAGVEPIVDAITPVPGGIGTVTTSVLVDHVVIAAERQAKK